MVLLKWVVFLDCCCLDTSANKPCFSECYGQVLESFFFFFFFFCCQVIRDSLGHKLSLWQLHSLFHSQVNLTQIFLTEVKIVHREGSGLIFLTLENTYTLSGLTNSRISIYDPYNWMMPLTWEVGAFFILVSWLILCDLEHDSFLCKVLKSSPDHGRTS